MFFFVVAEIDLAKYGNVKISGLYLSPNGQHALISLVAKSGDSAAEFLYLSRNSIKLKPVNGKKETNKDSGVSQGLFFSSW